MSLLIGLDVGWSEKRRTCGVAVLGARVEENGTVTYGHVSAVALLKRDVAGVLKPIVDSALREGQRVLIVADAIVGPHREPSENRAVDGGCSRGGFNGRAAAYPATHPTGRHLSVALHEVLEELVGPVRSGWTPWFGEGPLPESGVVVVETNPTPTMALALDMADVTSLPTRAKPVRLADGTVVRAKSDWYWRSGAGALAAETLRAPDVARERHHERVAGLWCLALAYALARGGAAALLGDEHGVYLTSTVDPSWRVDVERVGVRWGTVQYRPRKRVPPDKLQDSPAAAPSPPGTNVAGPPIREGTDDQALPENRVHVSFTDVGGLSVSANPWLEDLVAPLWLRLLGPTTVYVALTPFARQYPPRQFKVGPPTIRQLMRLWKGPDPLSGARPFRVDGEILLAPPGPGNRLEES
jgi:hypothetical protein